MKKRVRIFGIFLVSLAVLVLLLSFAGATKFTYEGNNVKKSYAGGDSIEGTFNISFNKEGADSVLSTNFGQNVSLLDFLGENGLESNVDFNCSTVSCGTDYTSVSSINSLSLTSGEKKYFGFRITGGDVEGISEIGVDITSNAASSCGEQLSVGLIGEETSLDFINSKYVDGKCGVENYGCFNLGIGDYEIATIGSNILCEKISLPSAPAYTLGARVKNATIGKTGKLKMQLYNLDGDFLIENVLPQHTQDTQLLKTIVNYTSSKGGEYFVCISGESGNDYKINRETSGENCGTSTPGSDVYTKDYEIFAYPLKSGAVNFGIREGPLSTVTGESILDFVEDYVFGHYSGSCSPECIIPVEISGVAQTVNFGNPQVKYSENDDDLQSNSLYSIVKKDAEITSHEMELDLSLLDIGIPLGTKNNSKFKLFLDGDLVFQKDIDVEESFDFSIKPSFVLVGIETVFEAVTKENISSSVWDFGDGGTRTGNGKKVSYAYTGSGAYEIEVELTNSKSVSSRKIFDVISGNAKESANITINKYEKRIANITKYYDSLSKWIRDDLEDSVNPVELSASLKGIKDDYVLAGNDSDYLDVINLLLKLEVPISVSVSEKGSLPIGSGLVGINTDFAEEISSKAGEGDLEEGIISWMNDNYGADVDYEVYEAFYDFESEEILTKFKFDIAKKSDFEENVYFFIDYPIESINFKEDYGQKQIGGGSGAYISLTGNNILEFNILEKISVEDLRAYISPDVKFLPVLVDTGDVREKAEDEFKFSFGKFGMGLIILIVIFFVVYIFLQEWYKRHYEESLFKSKDALYNLLSFIYNARVSGLRNSQIKQKLNENGWTGEQITYAFNKIDGRRTGMLEIPLFKSSENKMVRQEIQRRLPQGRMVDTRFIKRPRF